MNSKKTDPEVCQLRRPWHRKRLALGDVGVTQEHALNILGSRGHASMSLIRPPNACGLCVIEVHLAHKLTCNLLNVFPAFV